MIKKTENCLYCGEKMESITAKKKYCSAKCKLYFNRERNKLLSINKIASNLANKTKLIETPIKKEKSVESPKNDKIPPLNLKGLDLAIWKAENNIS